MLQRLAPEIQRYVHRGEECDRAAGTTADPMIKATYHGLAQSWRFIARNPAFLEALTTFLKNCE